MHEYYRRISGQRFHQAVLRRLSAAGDFVKRADLVSTTPAVLNLYRSQLVNVGDISIGIGLKDAIKRSGINNMLALSVDREQNYCPRAQSVLIGGGSIVSPRLINRVSRTMPDSRVALFGVEVFGTEGDLAHGWPKNILCTGARSPRSVERASSFGCDDTRLVPDAAWLIERSAPGSGQRGAPILGVNVTSWPKGYHFRRMADSEGWVSARDDLDKLIDYIGLVEAYILSALSVGWKVVFVPFEVDDYYFSRAVFGWLQSDWDGVSFLRFRSDPKAVLESVTCMSRFLATRYHAHVFSLIAGVPLCFVEYSMQVRELRKSLSVSVSHCLPIASCNGFQSHDGFVLSQGERDEIRQSAKCELEYALRRIGAFP